MKAPKVMINIATYFIISSQTFSFLPCFIHLSFAIICLIATQNTQPTKISMDPMGILSGFVAINKKFSRPEFSIVRPYRKSNINYINDLRIKQFYSSSSSSSSPSSSPPSSSSPSPRDTSKSSSTVL